MKTFALSVPLDERRILLHTCCAPCSGAIIENLVENGITPTIFFSNSNIVPDREYELRKEECIKYAGSYGLEVVDDVYDHESWLCAVKGLEDCPERGSRCLECFKFRLLRAADYAAVHSYKVLATTLASSRWKNLEQVNAAGKWACAQVDAVTGNAPIWWGQNWRKGGLQERRSEIIREREMYNQQYCGCEFSLKNLQIKE